MFDCDIPRHITDGAGLRRGTGFQRITRVRHGKGFQNQDLDAQHHWHKVKSYNVVGSDIYGHRFKRQTSNVVLPSKEEHLSNFKCNKHPTERCHETPRRVKTKKCEEREEQKCERVSSMNPRSVQHQSCHDAPYVECDVEEKQEMKVVQVPSYTEEYKEIPIKICDNYGASTLEVKCVNETKPVCEWKAAEPTCSKIPREHCYKIPYLVENTDCDENVKEDGGYRIFGSRVRSLNRHPRHQDPFSFNFGKKKYYKYLFTGIISIRRLLDVMIQICIQKYQTYFSDILLSFFFLFSNYFLF